MEGKPTCLLSQISPRFHPLGNDDPIRPIVIVGPRGIGKFTIQRKLTKILGDKAYSAVPTQILEKPLEEGEEMPDHRVTPEQFAEMKKNNSFICTIHDQQTVYGYSKEDFTASQSANTVYVLATSIEGLISIKSSGVNPIVILLKQRDLTDLDGRIRQREGLSQEAIYQKQKEARKDITFIEAHMELFDVIIENNRMKTTITLIIDHLHTIYPDIIPPPPPFSLKADVLQDNKELKEALVDRDAKIKSLRHSVRVANKKLQRRMDRMHKHE